jgi:DNA-binding IclR family transcriptional regulator
VDEGASLAVLEGVSVRFLDQAIHGHGIRAVSLVGSTLPAHSTANGKALLAALPPRTVEATMPVKLARLTSKTLVTRRALMAELESIRATGTAYDLEENETGVCAVGRVVNDAVGNLAAITIAVPATRFYGHEAKLAEALAAIVVDINEALGHSAD